jgi:hypothetical protein
MAEVEHDLAEYLLKTTFAPLQSKIKDHNASDIS